MADPYLGEIRIFGFNYAPYQWAECNGATLPLRQNTALFSLIGIAYGGNGSTTFQLPNLAGRGFCGQGQGPGLSNYFVGETFGQAAVTLTVNEMAAHTHQLSAYEGGTGVKQAGPSASGALSASDVAAIYANGTPNQTMSPATVGFAGGNLAHENRQPGLPLMMAIALTGTFPQFS